MNTQGKSNLGRALLTITGIIASLYGSNGVARGRDKREGVNFGTTVRYDSAGERSTEKSTDKSTSKLDAATKSVSPYLGYSFGELNLGIMGSSEERSSVTEETYTDGTKITRDDKTLRQGLNLYGRFNFGRVFFFEGAAGLYKQRQEIITVSKDMETSGLFTGEENRMSSNGIGPGYHLGFGAELPISNGFYFTTSYLNRMVQLRDQVTSTSLGTKTAQSQRTELMFGISYYDR